MRQAKTGDEYLMKRSIMQPDGCLYFTGPLDGNGYGNIWATRWAKAYKISRAHQLAFILSKGSYDYGLGICHSCDAPRCINPDHLWVGDQKLNLGDMAKKGRSARGKGVKAGRVKLTEDQVIFIKKNYKVFTNAIMAEVFNVKPETISCIVRGINWAHVEYKPEVTDV